MEAILRFPVNVRYAMGIVIALLVIATLVYLILKTSRRERESHEQGADH